MRKRNPIFSEFLTVLTGLILVVIAGVIVWGANWQNNQAAEIEEDSGLPTVNIWLNGVAIDTMRFGDKATKYPGNTVIVNDGGVETEYTGVEIKGRGNSTWVGPEKKPWQLKFSEETDLFGVSGGEKWILLADYFDTSHLRNYAAFEFTHLLEATYSKTGVMVEVYFDGEYEGIFYMIPKIDISENVVDLTDKWGVLVEIDDFRIDQEYYTSFAGNRIFLKAAVADKSEQIKADAMLDFMKNFNALEIAVKNKDYETVQALADVESFAQAFLVNEFTVDPDAYTVSFYLYKDGAGDKIHAGPMWDFDLGFGNKAWAEPFRDPNFYSPTETMIHKGKTFNQLIYGLMEMPEFVAEVKAVFQEKLSGRGAEFLALLEAENAKNNAAVMRDAEKWGLSNYEAEIEYVLDWIQKRYDYFEEIYGANKNTVD